MFPLLPHTNIYQKQKGIMPNCDTVEGPKPFAETPANTEVSSVRAHILSSVMPSNMCKYKYCSKVYSKYRVLLCRTVKTKYCVKISLSVN